MAANLALAKAFVELSLKGANAVVAGMNTVRQSIVASLAPIANSLAPAQNAIMGLVSAASPQAFNTFNGSVKLLSATMGTALVPQVMQASKWIQDLAQYIKQMDPETKKQIASWVGYSVVVMGAVVAFTKLSGVLDMIARHPVAATFLAISAAILKVNADMDKMIAKMNETISTMQRMQKGIYTEKEFSQSAAGALESDATMTDEEKLKKALAIRQRITDEVKAQSREGIERGSVGSAVDYLKGAAGFTNKTDELQTSIQRKLKEAGMLDDYIAKLKAGKKVTFTPESEINKGGKGLDLAMAGAGLGGGGGGGTVGLEAAFAANASAALAADEIQQKILQAQLEGNAEAQKTAAGTQRAAAALERMQQP